MPSPCLDATFHGRLNRVQFGIKIDRERKNGGRKKSFLSLSAFLIRINRCPKESGLINRYAKVCNIILVEWTFETARFILPPPRFLSQPRRGGALFGLSKQEAKGGLRGR